MRVFFDADFAFKHPVFRMIRNLIPVKVLIFFSTGHFAL